MIIANDVCANIEIWGFIWKDTQTHRQTPLMSISVLYVNLICFLGLFPPSIYFIELCLMSEKKTYILIIK